MSKIVIALGGNALGNNPEEQKKAVARTVVNIADLVAQGHEVVIGHGNGPQVGMIQKAFEGEDTPKMPLPECGAMSQGYIGYHMQNALVNEFSRRGMKKNVVTMITRVLVDEKDEAFKHPTKPIGHFLSEEEIMACQAQGIAVMEDAGRGFRQVVASPKPVDILEKESLLSLLKAGVVVIAGGGGGIPVIRHNGEYQGISAVIDKDFTGEKLAELIDADIFMILTAVEQVALNFGKPNEKKCTLLKVEDIPALIEEGHFAEGSMLPKVQAACAFASSHPRKTAIITSLEKAAEALSGHTGTRIE